MMVKADFRGLALLDPVTGKYGSASRSEIRLLHSDDFESSIPANWHTSSGGAVSRNTNTAENWNHSVGSLKAVYPLPDTNGASYVYGQYDLAEHVALGETNHVYIDFYARMPNSKQGLKFCKLFGQRSGDSYANMTFGLDYTGSNRGGMVYVGFGDGSEEENDTQNGIWLDGSNASNIGRSFGQPEYSVSTPQASSWLAPNWGTGWHRFQFYAKFSSGTSVENEIADGAAKVIIDGTTWLDAHGFFNRNYSNAPLDYVNFLEHAQTGTSGFDIWMDSIRISQNGWTR